VSNKPEDPEIVIRLNGEARTVPRGLNVLSLLEHLKLDPARVAVELNRVIVRKSDWSLTPVEDEASLEVVTFVGGGRL